MSYYTRLASTNIQEESIAAVERAFKKANTNIGGSTTIGKSPQSVIMDVYHNDSKIYVNADGDIKIDNEEFDVSDIEGMAGKIQQIMTVGRQAASCR